MQRFVLVQKVVCFLVFWSFGVSTSISFAQNESPQIPDSYYQKKLDSLDLAHDQDRFRSMTTETFNAFKSQWTEDQMLEGYTKILDLSKQHFGSNHRITALVQHQFGIYLYTEGEDEEALKLFENSIRLRKAQLPANHPELGHSYYLLGRTHYNLDNNEAAIEAFKHSLDVYESLQNCAMVVNNLRMLGDTYGYLEEQALAEAYYDLVLSNAKECYDFDNPALANLYLFAANVFLENPAEQEKALNYAKESQRIYERGNNETRANYVSALITQARIYIDTEKYQAATSLLNKALKIKNKLGNDYEVDAIYEYLGAIARRKKDYLQALDFYQRVYEIRSAEYDAVSTDMNYVYHNIAETYKESGDFSKAAGYYQKALIAADHNFTSTDYNDNPDVDTLDLGILFTDLIKDLDFKGQLFYTWYLKEGNENYLKIALSTYQDAIKVIDLKRNELISEGSKLFWQELRFPVFERALMVAFELEKKNSDPVLKSLIYQWMEQSKALVLLESLLNQQLEIDFEGKDSLTSQFNHQNAEVAQIQRQVIEDTQNQKLKIALKKAQIEPWETQKTLKEKNPASAPFYSESDYIDLATIQQQVLDDENIYVEYFVGKEKLFAFAMKGTVSYIYQSNLGDLVQKIDQLRKLLSMPNESLEAFQSYQQLSFELYDQLIGPIETYFSDEINDLVIIPDGILSALPFEVLLYEKRKQEVVNYSPDILPYLINKTAINYAFSIATLAQQRSESTKKAKYPYVGLAPAFTTQTLATPSRQCNQGSLAPLLENEAEVETIQALISGEIAKGEAATKAFFLRKGMQARILHLATHACIDDQEPSKSKIFFSDDHLYAHELYQLKLQAQMVVLSACETGVGVFQRGEGVMSLARGFAQSGAPSLTLSYWSVSDQSTAQVMGFYYQFLKQGQSKHRALRNAKMEYLNHQEQLQHLHPYYWSAFVHFGNVEPVKLSTGYLSYLPFAIIGPAVIGFLVYLFWSNKKNNSDFGYKV